MTRSVSKFNYADLHDVISGTSSIVKKEKGTTAIPKVPAHVPGKSTRSGTKKRKTLEILDLTIEDSEPAEEACNNGGNGYYQLTLLIPS